MTETQPSPERMQELLVDAAESLTQLGNGSGYVELAGHWRGTTNLIEFAQQFPTRESQNAAGALPRCVVFVEFARWALGDNATRAAISFLRDRADRILEIRPDSNAGVLAHAVVYAVLAAILRSSQGRNDCLQQAAKQFDQAWPLTEERTAKTPNVVTPLDCIVVDYTSKDLAAHMLDQMTLCGTFGESGIRVSTWLILHHLLRRIYSQDTSENISDNRLRVMFYDARNRKGHVQPALLEKVRAPRVGVYLDPLSFGVCPVSPSMCNSFRLGFRCCRQTMLNDLAAMRISADLPLTVDSLGGSSADGLIVAGMIITANEQSLDSTRTATCRFASIKELLQQPDHKNLDPAEVKFASVAGIVPKINAAWQKEHGLAEIFLHSQDEIRWRKANPGRRSPTVTPVENLSQLVIGLTANQTLDDEIQRHAESMHAQWEQVKQAIREETDHIEKDHRFDCYIEPNMRIEGPPTVLQKRDEASADEAGQMATLKGREREEIHIPGDTEKEQDESLLNLLEFSIRGTPLPVADEESEDAARPAWLKPGRPIVLYDNAGAGKTVCTHRIRHLLTSPKHHQRLFGHKSPVLVVRLDGRWLREFVDRGRPLTIPELLSKIFAEESGRKDAASQPFVDEIVAHALNENRVVLILDGFDQFEDVEQQHVATVFNTHKDARKCHWILTSRVHTIDEFRGPDQLFQDNRWTRVRIDPFEQSQQDRYFARVDANGRAIGPEWIDAIGGEENRGPMADLLQLPMVLWMIRELIDDARENHEPVPAFFTLSDLYLVTSRKLLARALKANSKAVATRLIEKKIDVPVLSIEQQLTELEHVLTLMAFQLMLMKNFNGEVRNDRITRFEELCLDRYHHELDQKLESEKSIRKLESLKKDLAQADVRWKWAIEVLKTIELSHRSVTEAYSDAKLAFRSRKMVECHAARYLTCYATQWDILAGGVADDMPEVDLQDDTQNLATLCAWNHTTDPEWQETWELAINMPQKPVSDRDQNGVIRNAVINDTVTSRSLSALFRHPKRYPGRDIRPTKLMYKAWHLFELDLPLLRERRYPISGKLVKGTEFDEKQLHYLGKELLLGELRVNHAVVKQRLQAMTDFRRDNEELLGGIESRLDTVLISNSTGLPRRVPLPADEAERATVLSQWQKQSSLEKSLTFLQCPPQSLLEAYERLTAEVRIHHVSPAVNPAIKGHENEAIAPFQLQATTVTRAMYARFDSVFQDSTVAPDWGDGDLKSTLAKRASAFEQYAENEDFPILCTNWYDASMFCKWLGSEYRLPTEFEWEHACRAGTTTEYHFGDGLNGTQANCDGNYPHGTDSSGKTLRQGPCLERTTPVGCESYPCNPYGLFDVHGNVWEWTIDNRDSDDAHWSSRVLRGGSWRSYASNCYSAHRHDYTRNERSYYIGFRVCGG